MFKKVEHIGIAINNLDKAESVFERLFGNNAYKREVVESEKVSTSFLSLAILKLFFRV